MSVKTVKAACLNFDAPPLLLGHSLGGIVISEVAQAIPTQIRGPVFLAAALLDNGEVRFEAIGAGLSDAHLGIRPFPIF